MVPDSPVSALLIEDSVDAISVRLDRRWQLAVVTQVCPGAHERSAGVSRSPTAGHTRLHPRGRGAMATARELRDANNGRRAPTAPIHSHRQCTAGWPLARGGGL